MGSFKDNPLLLRSIIMEHYERPVNKVAYIENEQEFFSHHNKTESCIDDITVYLKIINNKVNEAYFLGTGCAIATSSTDLICKYAKNKEVNELNHLVDQYLNMVFGKEYDETLMQELIAFYNISNQPNRIRCASIGIKALKECLIKYGSR